MRLLYVNLILEEEKKTYIHTEWQVYNIQTVKKYINTYSNDMYFKYLYQNIM